VSYDLPNKDFVELKDGGKLNIVSMPYSNGIQYLGMNVAKPPFNNPKVRQAVAYAVPYQKIMDAVLFGLAKPMFGAAGKRPRRFGPRRTCITPTLRRPRRCSPKPATPTASRPRCHSTLDSPGQ